MRYSPIGMLAAFAALGTGCLSDRTYLVQFREPNTKADVRDVGQLAVLGPRERCIRGLRAADVIARRNQRIGEVLVWSSAAYILTGGVLALVASTTARPRDFSVAGGAAVLGGSVLLGTGMGISVANNRRATSTKSDLRRVHADAGERAVESLRDRDPDDPMVRKLTEYANERFADCLAHDPHVFLPAPPTSDVLEGVELSRFDVGNTRVALYGPSAAARDAIIKAKEDDPEAFGEALARTYKSRKIPVSRVLLALTLNPVEFDRRLWRDLLAGLPEERSAALDAVGNYAGASATQLTEVIAPVFVDAALETGSPHVQQRILEALVRQGKEEATVVVLRLAIVASDAQAGRSARLALRSVMPPSLEPITSGLLKRAGATKPQLLAFCEPVAAGEPREVASLFCTYAEELEPEPAPAS